ncbi:MAG: MAPEG family protein [Gammaproteobacteria bacterium]|nr:MAPEG family protein [Gammaproteobacteria bacterium]
MVPVTAFYGSLMAVLILYLAGRVALCRKKNKIGLGDGGNRELNVLIRAHANAVENGLITVLLMLFAELNGLAALHLHTIGILLLGSRLAHAQGFIASNGTYAPGRFYGIIVNWLLILVLVVINVVLNFL